jgi:pyrroline-5-carboxylate reductase
VETIGFIGSGHMAEALISGILKTGVYPPEKVYISDIRPERLEQLHKHYGVQTTTDNCQLASHVDVLMLSVKPQVMKAVLEDIKEAISDRVLVISIAAGITTALITSILGDVAIVRVMPNMPAWIEEGASALYANKKAAALIEKAQRILQSVGKAIVVEEEALIDPVTAVSGSGPAYFFLLMQEMIKAGVEMGLSEKNAQSLVLQTAKGAALLAEKVAAEGRTPAQLAAEVATPNGTTEAALNVFGAQGFGATVSAALHQASERARELSAGQ